VGIVHRNGVVRFIFIEQQEEIDDKSIDDENNYNKEDMLIDAIRNHDAIAACDASVKYNAMASF